MVRAFFAKPSRAIVAGYLALALAAAAILGVWIQRANTNEVKAEQAQLRAATAELKAAAALARAEEAQANAKAQCLARAEARRDNSEILLAIIGLFPEGNRTLEIRNLIADLPPIEC